MKLTVLSSRNGHNEADEEQARISTLYRQQSQEYMAKARENFVKAVKQEIEEDVFADSPAFLALSDDESKKRVKLFCHLFGGEKHLLVQVDQSVEDQETSLAERLAKLNESLPKGFKTSDERMRDIDRGLNRLGLSLYSHADEKPKIELPKSETDQLNEIIAQAKDEARFGDSEGGKASSGTWAEADSLDDESIASANSASVDSAEKLDIQDRKAIQDYVVEAQAKLAELVALLEVDLDDKAADQDFDHSQARKVLKESRRVLLKASKQWDEAIL